MTRPVSAVVGVGPGLGLAVARRFGRDGYRVALVGRRADALESYREFLQAVDVDAEGFAADAGDPATLEAAFGAIRERLGDPSVLVYNAAVLEPGLSADLAPGKLARDFDVNVIGALAAAQQVLPAMRAAGAGTILFTGGGLSLEPYPRYTALAAGKAALRSLAFSMHKEFAPDGIHVAVVTVCGLIAPGTPFDPDRVADAYWQLHAEPPGAWRRELVFQPPATDPDYNAPDRG